MKPKIDSGLNLHLLLIALLALASPCLAAQPKVLIKWRNPTVSTDWRATEALGKPFTARLAELRGNGGTKLSCRLRHQRILRRPRPTAVI